MGGGLDARGYLNGKERTTRLFRGDIRENLVSWVSIAMKDRQPPLSR